MSGSTCLKMIYYSSMMSNQGVKKVIFYSLVFSQAEASIY